MTLAYWTDITTALFGAPLPEIDTDRDAGCALPSAYAVSDFAAATIGAAGVALGRLGGVAPGAVRVDRRRASLWFDMTLRPDGWDSPDAWDALSANYRARDGWIRLHTNAPHHRAAALRVVAAQPGKDAFAEAIAAWSAADLEDAIVRAGGCAAQLRAPQDWARHPQGRAVRAEPLIHWDQRAAQARHGAVGTPGRPLGRCRVLDLTRILAGPVATRFLAGFGADVLRIDPPGWTEPAVEQEITLGKRCAELDLRAAADRRVFERLLREADILVHGLRPGALAGLGYDTPTLRGLNPDLIDVTLCAYGWTGPWAQRRGFDSLVQMSTGIAAPQGDGDARAPRPLPVQALDHGTGYLMAAAAVQALALREQGRIASARLSLARSAHLLMQCAGSLAPAHPVTLRDDDLAPAPENTHWGPARRVAPPVQVGDWSQHWDRAAGPLRRDPPQWRVE
ncbi:CoA transferase [Sulfitobacter sabulilitoris]|uniref:Acyl-CoA transferase n=1 Tax=Sulfitobacter sabulilitoris TaxID=2562655 RepID=A0A5S3PI78_9RHOB|nr:CoA transferase [Sulfitobacter sabulilitoris]TMM54038.1 acyl-CoA transferase [Sulfitobacter sabulilitoris]